MGYSDQQAELYDEQPVLIPWPKLLTEAGFKWLYKPREIFWKLELDKLSLSAGQSTLEVGCGRGEFLTRMIKEYKIKGTGIDVSGKSIAAARRLGAGKFLKAKATKLPFKNSCFEAVVSFDVLEHIERQEQVIKEMARVLKPGGKILIYTLNKNDHWSLDWWREKAGMDIYSWAGHKRELFVDPNKLVKDLTNNDIQVDSLKYFDSLFTLGLDEVIMGLIGLIKKLGGFKSKKLGWIILPGLSWLSKSLFGLLNWLDSGWYGRGLSLSFCVRGEKNQ